MFLVKQQNKKFKMSFLYCKNNKEKSKWQIFVLNNLR